MTSTRKFPNFIVIGGMKCGSTSLFEYLRLHPDLSPCKLKEPSFFSKEWDKGVSWYEALFENNDKMKFEASTSYSKHPWFEETPARIRETLPDVKLVYIVRHPIRRLTSQIHHNLIVGRLTQEQVYDQDFWHGLGGEYINFSMYYSQIKHYLKMFEKERLHVITLEDLSSKPANTLSGVAQFIGLNDGFFRNQLDYQQFNVSGNRTKVKYNPINRGLRYLNRKGIIPPVHDRLSHKIDRPVFSNEVLEHMWCRIDPDMASFEEFMGRNLGYRLMDYTKLE